MFPTVESSQKYTTFPTGYDVGNLYDTHSAICIVLFPIRATSSCLPSSIRPVDVLHFEDVPKAIANYHVCIAKSMRIDSDIISRAIQMQLKMQYGVGMEGVDIDPATKHGIKVARIPSDVMGNAASCAEMAIYLMMGLLSKQVFLCCWISLGWRLKDALFGGVGAINIKSTEKNSEAQLFGDGRLLRLKLSFKLAILMLLIVRLYINFSKRFPETTWLRVLQDGTLLHAWF